MRAIKLFRRDPTKLTLRERAASLKATAGRVLRRKSFEPAAMLGAGSDPAFATIREHRAAYAAWKPHLHAVSDAVIGSPAYIAAEAAGEPSRLRDEGAFAALMSASPTTLDGLVALADYLPDAIVRNGRADADDDGVIGLTTICEGLRALVERGVIVANADTIDWHNPPAGFMAYPPHAPMSFLNIKEGLRLETERLHGIALAEFERRREAFRPSLPGPSEADWSADLRRTLRLDALAAAASPERAEPAGNEHSEPGFVLYEDAAGRTHRRSVAHWIGFMAQRLYGVARQEESRAFNVESRGLTQDECRPIEDRLRRDLRLDALHDLAHRWEDIFEVSREYAVGGRWRQEKVEAPTHDLSGCALPELARLYEAWEGVHMHLSGAGAAPCFSEPNNGNFRPAGEALESECERAGGFLDAIAQEARKRTPVDDGEVDERLNVLVRHEMNTNGRPASAALLAELVATVEV